MLNQINFFQLDNLIQNRVPFVLLNLGPSLQDLYQNIFKRHIENNEVLTTENEVLAYLENRKIPHEAAIVLLCEDGQKSFKLLIELQKKAYTNVYAVNGGYRQMMTERSEV